MTKKDSKKIFKLINDVKIQQKLFLFIYTYFLTEVLIVKFMHHNFIRYYGGDFLVVILIYFFVKAFIQISNVKTGIYVLLFSYSIEVLQYYHFVKLIGLQNSKLALIILGDSFSFTDLLVYTLGILFVLIFEGVLNK